MDVALLAGGTGGAKLAVGLRDLVIGTKKYPARRPGKLDVVANTADDIEIYGVHVSPDPDLITYRLADVVGELGFGIDGEQHTLMDARRAAGEEVWFELGDEDMAVCATRARLLAAGETLTAAHAAATADYDCGGASVLPMSDDPVRTVVGTNEGERGIQQFLIQDRSAVESGALQIESVRFEGIEQAQVTDEVREAIVGAQLIVIGPSNPQISIAPILETPGLLEALHESRAPVMAVSPLVAGKVVKGPTAAFVEAAGFPVTATGIADLYAERWPDLIDAWIAEEPVHGHAHSLADLLMDNPVNTRRVASSVIQYGASLAPTAP